MRTTILILVSLLALAAGCVETTPQTKATVQQIQQKNQVDLAKQQADAALNAARAKANPIGHPIANINEIVAAVRNALLPLFVISIIVLGGLIGLEWTPLSFISKIGLPIAAGASGLMLLNLFALPLLPWGLLIVLGLVAGLLIYEIIRYKSLAKGIQALEADLGWVATPVTSASVAAAQAAIAAVPLKMNVTTTAAK